MAKGISIHIGLNYINPRHYGCRGQLPFCKNDANVLADIAVKEGFKLQDKLINEKATSTNLLNALNKASTSLEPGDILLVTYSGHGSVFPDLNGDEDDRFDETWVLYDRMLVDDELYYAWSKFAPGVRILLISDSCYSGTVAKPLLFEWSKREDTPQAGASLREMLKCEAELIYKNNKAFYERHIKQVPSPKDIEVSASLILLASSQDSQPSIGKSRDGRKLSLFTSELLTVYEHKIASNYRMFLTAIGDRIPKALNQTPNYYQVGATNKVFANQVPFTI